MTSGYPIESTDLLGPHPDVEIVAPQRNLAVLNLEHAGDRDLRLFVAEVKDVNPLVENGAAIGYLAKDFELNSLSHRQERVDHSLDRFLALRSRAHWDILILGIFREEAHDLVKILVLPDLAE